VPGIHADETTSFSPTTASPEMVTVVAAFRCTDHKTSISASVIVQHKTFFTRISYKKTCSTMKNGTLRIVNKPQRVQSVS